MSKDDLLRHFEKIKKANREGYAGCLSNGQLVDRRENPEGYPVAENSLFGVTKPRCVSCGEVAPIDEIMKSLCRNCRVSPEK